MHVQLPVAYQYSTIIYSQFNKKKVLHVLNWTLSVYYIRLDWLPLPCITVIQPSQLSCLDSSVGRASTL